MKKIIFVTLLAVLVTTMTSLFVTTHEDTWENDSDGPGICAALGCGGFYASVVESKGWPASVSGTEYTNISYSCAHGGGGSSSGFDIDINCVNDAIERGRDSAVEEFFSVTGLLLNFGAYFVLSASLFAMGEAFVSVSKQRSSP